jgi:glycosyltransferase involved in cell wall biosynthesis
MRDVACTRATHLHEVSQVSFEQSLTYIEPERVTFIPYPIDDKILRSSLVSRDSARRELGLAEDSFVVLSVSALNRGHKRVHHLIEEISRVEGATFLCVGRVEDPDLLDEGRRKLGSRFIHTLLPFDRMGVAYSAADVFALGSVEEGFAMAVVEAMLCEIPVLVHSSEHFEWLVQDPECLVDMTEPGALAKQIGSLSDSLDAGRLKARRDVAHERFSWEGLSHAYVSMYERVSGARR